MSIRSSADRCPVSRQSRSEEIVNALTHGLGLLLGVSGLVVLVVLASLRGGAGLIVACCVYGSTLVLLYVVSTLYHAARSTPRKRWLQILDHACIYLLIAGTYTPFTLVSLRGGWGWSLFGVVWGLALLGVVLKVFVADRYELLSTLTYLALGWLGLIAAVPLWRELQSGGLAWLFLGGAAYTVGTIFYGLRRMPFHHAVWHLFVLAGSICHYFAVMLYVVPRG